MAECSASFSEEEFSYFCLACSSKYKETGKKFTRVYYQGSCFTCAECWGTFFNGFKAPKIHSTDMPSHRIEEVFSENEFSYFCFECGNKTEETEKNFIYVGGVGPCYSCSQCGVTFDAGFKQEKMKSQDTSSHRGEKVFAYFCRLCSRKYKETGRELTLVSSKEFCFTCAKCHGGFFNGYKMLKTLRCEECDQTFLCSSTLLYHSYEHSGQWPYRCPFCQKGCATASQIEIHLKRRNVIRTTTCGKCLESFQVKICPGVYRKLSSTRQLYCGKCSRESSPAIEHVTFENVARASDSPALKKAEVSK